MNFDAIAPLYDGLAKLVFGSKAWENVQCYGAEKLRKHPAVLILGGGTGKILETTSAGQTITFLDASAKMLQQASERPTSSNVTFIQEDFLKWESRQKYDAIYCPFFLDCFDEDLLKQVVEKLATHLKPNGRLYVLDFRKTKTLKHRLLLAIMHAFFKVTTGLAATRLLDHHAYLDPHFSMQEETLLRNGSVYFRGYTMEKP